MLHGSASLLQAPGGRKRARRCASAKPQFSSRVLIYTPDPFPWNLG